MTSLLSSPPPKETETKSPSTPGVEEKGKRVQVQKKRAIAGDWSVGRAANTKKQKCSPTLTLTFGDQCESHAGMEKQGTKKDEGFTCKELEAVAKALGPEKAEVVDLRRFLPDEMRHEASEASVLVAKEALDVLIPSFNDREALTKELFGNPFDREAPMYGQVRKKHARACNCIANEAQAPDIANGKGTVVAFKDSPYASRLRDQLPKWFGPKASNLVAECNLYEDPGKKHGIGFHGDAERKIVIGFRFGGTMKLKFQWFQRCKPIGKPFCVDLPDQSFYIMSDKAVGYDWKKSSKLTLRHAAGAPKYLTPKEPKSKSKVGNLSFLNK